MVATVPLKEVETSSQACHIEKDVYITHESRERSKYLRLLVASDTQIPLIRLHIISKEARRYKRHK